MGLYFRQRKLVDGLSSFVTRSTCLRQTSTEHKEQFHSCDNLLNKMASGGPQIRLGLPWIAFNLWEHAIPQQMLAEHRWALDSYDMHLSSWLIIQENSRFNKSMELSTVRFSKLSHH